MKLILDNKKSERKTPGEEERADWKNEVTDDERERKLENTKKN